ncbi:hypothetical protein GALMADRAFT_216467 [Galerina marginata CBS 339.88]|uniref:Uncharacterized protein n=1 Tax=Galerina marginata (strain CBS 339.88) TaxID=685588 RepID=A0A067SI27_GALM3|nr:hypothetical protein GALMADRAFT_216467 [Galerina marginata CBS 339.88]
MHRELDVTMDDLAPAPNTIPEGFVVIDGIDAENYLVAAFAVPAATLELAKMRRRRENGVDSQSKRGGAVAMPSFLCHGGGLPAFFLEVFTYIVVWSSCNVTLISPIRFCHVVAWPWLLVESVSKNHMRHLFVNATANSAHSTQTYPRWKHGSVDQCYLDFTHPSLAASDFLMPYFDDSTFTKSGNDLDLPAIKVGEQKIDMPADPKLTRREIHGIHSEIQALCSQLGIPYKDASHRLYLAEMEKLEVNQSSLKAFTALSTRARNSFIHFQQKLEGQADGDVAMDDSVAVGPSRAAK